LLQLLTFLTNRNKKLNEEVSAYRKSIAKVEEQRELFKGAFKQVKKEKDQIAQNCEKLKKEKEKFKVKVFHRLHWLRLFKRILWFKYLNREENFVKRKFAFFKRTKSPAS